jgi:hypothetical protein
MGTEKKIIEWESLSKWEMGVMVIMLPIFAVVAGLEHIVAKLTGATYNEVNIIVYYLLIPLSWTVMVDYITMLPFLTPMYIIVWVIFLWKDQMKFRDRCDWAFDRSVEFLLWFKKIGWNYVVGSVIICVVVPVLIYVELIYGIIKIR